MAHASPALGSSEPSPPIPESLRLRELSLDEFRRLEESQSPLYNRDLAPVPLSERTWTTYNFAALWISMAHCIPTYMLASGLIGAGMTWWQALLTILLGNTIVLLPILLNSHPGTAYGIPFPVLLRASFGTVGANLPAIMRALVACGWFGINAWIGGAVLHTFFTACYSGWPTLLGATAIDGYLPSQWLSFLLFWLLNLYVIYRGMDLVRRVENFAAPFVLVMAAVLLIWAVNKANGFGPIFQDRSDAGGTAHLSSRQFWAFFPVALTGMIGFWATLSLNMPDFTRYAQNQRAQMIGQSVALPTTMFGFSAMAVVITSATQVIFGRAIWQPEVLIGELKHPLWVGLSALTLVIATLAVNIAANVVSPANDFANAWPRVISFRRGAFITGLLGILCMPWKLIEDPRKYLEGWLVPYSGGLGSIGAVMIVDYWLIRKRKLSLLDLYLPDGSYRYQAGWNWKAVVATLAGCFLAWGGLVIPTLRPLFDYAWFVGFMVSGAVYFALMQGEREPSALRPQAA
ncbi:MAG: NCS1 family nucleobase:cation symporter-1 [Myxococcales bacterium]|nr:NCS1 family nucleobase:cation symporter-1 [Myxococcales bacterium]